MQSIFNWLIDMPNFIVWYPVTTCFVGFLVGYLVRRKEDQENY